jgi:ACS family hexuronate transporter-like MFS transporter
LTKISYVPFFLLGAALVPLGMLAIFVFAGDIKRVELKKNI